MLTAYSQVSGLPSENPSPRTRASTAGEKPVVPVTRGKKPTCRGGPPPARPLREACKLFEARPAFAAQSVGFEATLGRVRAGIGGWTFDGCSSRTISSWHIETVCEPCPELLCRP